jgi:hypothetical protein
MDHQRGTPAAYTAAIHNEHHRLQGEMTQQGLRIGQKVHIFQDVGVVDPPRKAFDTAFGFGAVGHFRGDVRQLGVLSQITENRKVEARKSLIFRHTIFTFGLKNATLRQNPQTSRIVQAWFDELGDFGAPTAFPNARGGSLSREGVDYLLQRAVDKAATRCPSLRTKRITPHVLRHTTALHLLQSGVDIAVIALWLGHESIETTHVYIEVDLAHKEQALQKLASVEGQLSRFTAEDPLLAFLTSL